MTIDQISNFLNMILVIVAVWFGSILNNISQRRHERYIEQRLSQSVRTLLQVEVTYNFNLVSSIKQMITESKKPGDENQLVTACKRYMIHQAAPTWEYLAWHGLIQHIPLALDYNQTKLRRTYEFYNKLNQLTALWAKMTEQEAYFQAERLGQQHDQPSAFIVGCFSATRQEELANQALRLIEDLASQEPPMD